MIGDRADAPAVSDMVQAHVAAGALDGHLRRTISTYPLVAAASRRHASDCIALVRLGSYDALAAAALDARSAGLDLVAGRVCAAARSATRVPRRRCSRC